MELVMFVSMLLFTGFCTFILVLAISRVAGKKEDEPSLSAITTQTDFHDRKTLV